MPYSIRRWRFSSFYGISILGTSSLSPKGNDRSDKHLEHGAEYPIGYLESTCQLFVKDELFFYKKDESFLFDNCERWSVPYSQSSFVNC